MSSVAHAKVQTIDKECLLNAAKDLKMQSHTDANGVVTVGATRFEFKNGTATVSFYDDIKSVARNAKQLTQLSSFYTMKKRLEARGMKLETSTKDVVAAVNSNQSIEMEFVNA
jgi:hypothetical protein